MTTFFFVAPIFLSFFFFLQTHRKLALVLPVAFVTLRSRRIVFFFTSGDFPVGWHLSLFYCLFFCTFKGVIPNFMCGFKKASPSSSHQQPTVRVHDEFAFLNVGPELHNLLYRGAASIFALY